MSGDMDIMLEFTSNMARFSADMSRAADAVTNAAGKMEGSMTKSLKQVSKESKHSADQMEEAFKKSSERIRDVMLEIFGVEMFKKYFEAVSEAEQATSQITAALNSTKGAAGLTRAQLKGMAEGMKELTAYDDDAVAGMQSVLLTFTKVGKQVFPQASQAILDMSTRLGQDLKTSAVQVGKALQDPIKGITALKRVGVDFSESQVSMIKHMVETGHTMDAQKVILQELQTEFGGSAVAARDTLGGALQALQARLGDTFKAIGAADGGSLRYGLELAVTGFDMLTESIEQFSVKLKNGDFAASDMGKTLAMLGKGASDLGHVIYYGMNEAVGATETLIGGIDSLVGALMRLIGVTHAFGGFQKDMKEGPLGQFFGSLNNATAGARQNLKNVMSGKTKNEKDYLGLSTLWDDMTSTTNERLDKMHKLSANAGKGPKLIDTDGMEGPSKEEEKAAKKRETELKNEQKSLASIVDQYKLKVAQLKQEVSGQKQDNDLLAMQEKISKLINLPAAERKAALAQINALHKQELQLLHEKAVAQERDKLKDVLDNLKKQNEEMSGKNQKQEELKPLIEAEAKIRDLVKVGLGENLDLQQQIRAEAEKQVELIKQQKHDEALKNLKEITAEYDKQNAALEAQLNGTDDLLPLLEQEKKIREDMNLTDQEKSDGIQYIEDQFNRQKALTQAIEDQKQAVEDIKSSSLGYKDKLGALSDALNNGKINTKQWTDTVKQLYDEQLKAKTGADQFAHSLVNGLSQAITSGKNFKQVLVDMGKQLAAFAAQKLLLQPLENAIANIGNKLMGTGQYTQNPFSQGGSGSAGYGGSLANGGGAGNLAGYSPSNSMLGVGGGGIYGAPGQLSTGGGSSGVPPLLQLLGNANNAVTQGVGTLFGTGAGNLAGSIMGAGTNGLLGLASALGIPGFATGGYSQGGMALVGEQGPEFVRLPAGAQVYSNLQSQSMGGPAAPGAAHVDMTDPSQYNFRLNPGFYQDPYYDGFQQELADMETRYEQERARKWVREHPGVDTIGAAKMAEIASNQWGILGSPSDIVRAGGRTGWGAGNQHVALMQMYMKAGISVSPRMMAAARLEDDNWNSSDFHIMSLPTGNGVTSFGAGDGGADGSSVAGYGVNEGFDYSQQGKQVGSNYIGASQEYLNNIQSWKTPSGVGPGADSQISMDSNVGSAPVQGFGGRSSEYQMNPDGTMSPINRGSGSYKFNGSGYDFVPNFDPTVDSNQYQHQDGTFKGLQADWNKNARNVGTWSELAAILGEALGAPGTLGTSQTGRDIFATDDMTMTQQRPNTFTKKFYSYQTDGFTAGQIAGQMGLKGYADGGRPGTDGPVLVGERGKELFWPDSQGTILNNQQTEQMMKGTAPEVHLHNHTGVEIEKPEFTQAPDGTFHAILKAVAANAAKQGPVAQGVSAIKRRPVKG